ncbi:MAG TPA: hypothetical protein VKE96_16430 [Vicinamibacterales bacterium]|nr:hypothetical protein [Vicinamibacterales bacterium]
MSGTIELSQLTVSVCVSAGDDQISPPTPEGFVAVAHEEDKLPPGGVLCTGSIV